MKYDGTPIEKRPDHEIKKIRTERRAKIRRCRKRIGDLLYAIELAEGAILRCDNELHRRAEKGEVA